MQQDVNSPRPMGRRSGWSRYVAKAAKLAAAIVAAGAMARTAHGALPTTPSASFFPIGVYGQQADAFATWKARGVNTVVGFNTPGAWQDYWNDAAVSMGLWQIRNPRLNLAADVNQPYLLAWSFNDLPDVNKVPARTLAATYAQMKAADPSRDVIINLSAGSAISQTDGITDADYRLYTGTADLVSSEVFPVAALNQPSWIDKGLSYGSLAAQNAGAGIDKLRALSGGKRQYAYIETSDQDGAGPKRGPTADEVRGETWDAIVHGARGIIYSPQGSNTADATPSDVAAAITLTDATITRYSAVLNAIAGDQANTLDLPGGLEATWRDYHGQRYFFVLNDSHAAVTKTSFTLTGLPASETLTLPDESRSLAETDGVVTDSFSPYQLHIYTGSAGVGSSVPEPHGGAAVLGAIACLIRRRRKTV
jgi:hypothetical protein